MRLGLCVSWVFIQINSERHSIGEEEYKGIGERNEGSENGKGAESTHTMLCLTSRAMAKLTVQRLLPADLVFHLPAVAIGFVESFELAFLVDAVGCAFLPFAQALCLGAARLVLRALFFRGVFFHGGRCGVQ